MKMSFEDYANHISQKLKLAVSMAIIRSLPKNVTTDEYINQLKSNILDQKDSNSDISVCSDDFELDNSNFENNNNKSDNNNHPDNNETNNANLSNNFNEDLINNNKGDNINNNFDNNCIIDREIDNITSINQTKGEATARNEENIKINDTENYNIEINEEEYIPLETDDYNHLIDEVLQLDESQTILKDFCVNDTENIDNMNNDRDVNFKHSKEMSTQYISHATQAIDFTQTLDFDDQTYYESNKDTRTEKTTKINQKLPNSYRKVKKDDKCIIKDDSNTKKSNLKHDISIEDGPSPKRRKNVYPKLPTNIQIKDPNSRIKNNISKFLDKNNIASKAKSIVENDKAKDNLDNKVDKKNYECTQTNTYYSQSQPLLVIDQKYIYEKSKSMPRIEKGLNIETELNEKDLSIGTNDVKPKNNKVESILHDITDKNTIITNTTLETASEVSNKKKNTMKIIENDTVFHFEREVCLFSQTSLCDVTNNKLLEDVIHDDRNNTNNRINEIITKEKQTNAVKHSAKDLNTKTEAGQNINNRKEIQLKIDLTQEFNSVPEKNNNNGNRNPDNNNSNNFNNNETTQSSTNSIGFQLSPLYQNSNNETTQSNRNRDNNNRNNNHNESTTQSTQYTLNELLVEELEQNEEILNQSPNSNSDLTDSDENQKEEVIPFKIIEELNKVKNYLNKIDKVTDSSSDTGYKSDSQSRHSLKLSQSNVWLNQSAHSLFSYITSCELVSNTQEITREISVVLAQLIQKLYEDEIYLSFMEEMLNAVDLLLHSVLDENSEENEFLKQDKTMQRILLLNKSIHIQKYTIEKITHILENIHTNLTKDTLYEMENIQKIENSCYIFHILQIILQRYYKNKDNLTKKQDSSQKSQFGSQKSQFGSQKSQYSSQKSQFSSQNSQEVLKKTDISDIWRKKWNPNFKEDKIDENVDQKCALSDCSKVLNKLIVSCMDGYSLIAYFALKCFNLMQS